ncbi:MAG TPA: TIGR03118 family protein, partial [Ktedonobacterales bacterium]
MRMRFFPRWCQRALLMAICALALLVLALGPNTVTAQGGFYQVTKLVSNVSGTARVTDPNLVNSWGLARSPSGPWRVTDNGTGVVTSYLGDGTRLSPVVTVPPPAGSPPGTTAKPTGNVYNPVNGSEPFDFTIQANGRTGPAIFVFSTEDGTLSGWNSQIDATHAIRVVDRSNVDAVYKGLAYGRTNTGLDSLYATNFHAGTVEQFDNHFRLVRSFTDPQLANNCPLPGQCYAPFGIRNQGGVLVVTFALQAPGKEDDQAGPGNGF